MGAPRAGIGLLLSVMLTGCAASDGPVGSSEADSSVTPSSTSSASSPPDSAEPPEPTPSSPADGIPADLVLPAQADGQVEPRTDAGRLYDYICLDPEQQWTLGMGFVEAQTVIFEDGAPDRAVTIQKLVAYASVASARRAVRGLLAQVELCGTGGNHVGRPSTWRASQSTGLQAADQSVRLTYRTDGVVGTVLTVVRVGRAVFYVDRREQYVDGVPTDERTVAGFIPTLAKAFR